MLDTVGFIGVGKMGGLVAERIQAAGFPMVVYDLNAGAQAPFVARGARSAGSAAEVARLCDVIITALPTPSDVEITALGRGGILEGIRKDGIYVDISTGGPDLIRRIAGKFRDKGAWAVDAPVSIGQPGSPPGVHEIMVGAERAIFERILPILKTYGDQIIHAGDVGAGSICKIIHQLIGAGCTQAIAEGLTLGVKAGVDVKVVWDSVRRGLVGRMQMLHEQVPESVFTGVYEPTVFTLSLLRKDVGLAMRLGRELGVPLLVGSVAEQILAQAINRGWGNGAGYTVTYRLQEEAAAVSLRASGVDPARAAKYISTHGSEDAFTEEQRMSEQNKQLVRRFYEEVENQGKLNVVDELFSPDFRDVHNSVSPFPVRGIEGVKKLATALHDFLDLKVIIEDLVAEGDRVVARLAFETTHKNPFMGVAPTGRKFALKGVEIFRVAGGKLVERWVYIDQLPMMRELGVVPK